MNTMKTLSVVVLTATVLFTGCEGEDSSTVEGPEGGKLTLKKPDDVTLKRGGFVDVTIKISRKDLDQKINIQFTGLPDGVSVVDPDKSIVGDEAIYRLQATDSATLVSDQVKVTARAEDSDIAVAKQFSLTVEQANSD